MTVAERQWWKNEAVAALRNAIRDGDGPAQLEAVLRDLRRNGFPQFALDHLDRVAHKHYADRCGVAVVTVAAAVLHGHDGSVSRG